MTIQNIKKALEICSKDDGCRECPYYDYHRCDKVLLKDALALITEQVVEQNQKYQEQRIKQAQLGVLGKLWSNISNSKQLIQSHIADCSFTIEDIYMEIDELMAEVEE